MSANQDSQSEMVDTENNVHEGRSESWLEHAKKKRGHGGDGGDGVLEPRVAKLESDVSHILATVDRLDRRIEKLDDKMDVCFNRLDEKIDRSGAETRYLLWGLIGIILTCVGAYAVQHMLTQSQPPTQQVTNK